MKTVNITIQVCIPEKGDPLPHRVYTSKKYSNTGIWYDTKGELKHDMCFGDGFLMSLGLPRTIDSSSCSAGDVVLNTPG